MPDPSDLEAVEAAYRRYAEALGRFLASARCAGSSADAGDPGGPWGDRLTFFRGGLNRTLALDALAVDSARRDLLDVEGVYRIKQGGGNYFAGKLPDHIARIVFAVNWSSAIVEAIAFGWGFTRESGFGRLVSSLALIVPADWWEATWTVEPTELGALGAALGMIETGCAVDSLSDAQALLPPTLTEQFTRLHPGSTLSIEFLSFMEDRASATFREIVKRVYKDNPTDDGAIRGTITRTNTRLQEMGSNVWFEVGSRQVVKTHVDVTEI